MGLGPALAAGRPDQALAALPRREDGDATVALQLEEVPVPGHEHVRTARHRRAEDGQVVWIPARRCDDPRWQEHLRVLAYEGDDLVRLARRHPESPGEVPSKLAEDVLGSDELVALEADREQSVAQPTGAERREEDVGVEDDPHDTVLKTSSSVSSPWASAKGSAFSRSARKRSVAR